jgi:site-specific DNA recombinase
MNKPAAIYARVSSDRQKENHTIASQTAALIEYAQKNGYNVPPEWVFQDEGYSGAILVRPGLEALRDLAAEGQIAAALVYSPDRLSRKYAYQVLLSEELSRCGVELIFLKAPAGATPEDQLLVQFQGMIAEYERAQIAERCRRGKKHMAQQGGVNVLSGAPYGYRYVRKSDTSAAFYEVVETEAKVVRMVFEIYTQQRLSINAIARLLNERRSRHGRAKADGNDLRFGACSAILLIGERLAMAKPSSGPGNGSRARSVNGKPCRVVTLADMSDRVRSGLRSRCRLW